MATIIDKATRFVIAAPIARKSDAVAFLRRAIPELQLATGRFVRRYHSDNAKELRPAALLKHLEQQGTTISTNAPDSPSSNPDAEQFNRSLMTATRAVLASSALPPSFWPCNALDAAIEANYIPRCQQDGRRVPPVLTLPQVPHRRYPTSAAHFLPFGTVEYVTSTTPHPRKLAPRAFPARYLYAPDEHYVVIWRPDTRITRTVRRAEFAELRPSGAPPTAALTPTAPFSTATPCSSPQHPSDTLHPTAPGADACAALVAPTTPPGPTAPRNLAAARACPDAAE